MCVKGGLAPVQGAVQKWSIASLYIRGAFQQTNLLGCPPQTTDVVQAPRSDATRHESPRQPPQGMSWVRSAEEVEVAWTTLITLGLHEDISHELG